MRRFVELIELMFRHAVAYPLLRLLFHNYYSDKPLNLQSVRTILILRYDRIGDMIVTTPIFRLLKQKNPALKIAVFTSKGNAEIIQGNPFVDNLFILDRNWIGLFREVLRARREEFDVVLNFIFNRTTSAGILANLVAPNGFKVGQGADKYRFYFNRLLRLERSEKHMVEVLVGYIESVFGIPFGTSPLSFEININKEIKQQVDLFLEAHQLHRRDRQESGAGLFCVVNTSATDEERRISPLQITAILNHLVATTTLSVIVTCMPGESQQVKQIVERVGSDRIVLYTSSGQGSLHAIASLIGGAICVITPDTSIVHFASAMKTPVLGFFSPLQIAHEWVPYEVRHCSVLATPEKAVSAIPIREMTDALDNFLPTLKTNNAVNS
jgi:ADP-heptose:LPS heptosyltransferase